MTLDAKAGTITFAAPSGSGSPAAAVSTLSVGSGRKVIFISASCHSGLSVLTVNYVEISGTLDLTNNDVLVQSHNKLSTVTSDIASGSIMSSTATTDSTHLTTLGVMLNDDGTGNSIYVNGVTFDGLTPSAGYTLVKYTYIGDTNLDGKVDGTDYARIDNGYLTNATGWHNGDLNHDGVINGSDYTLIDNAFNMQGAAIPAAEVAVPTAMVAGRGLPFAQNQITVDGLDDWFKKHTQAISLLVDVGQADRFSSFSGCPEGTPLGDPKASLRDSRRY